MMDDIREQSSTHEHVRASSSNLEVLMRRGYVGGEEATVLRMQLMFA